MDASSRLALEVVRQRLEELTQPASGVLGRAKDVLTRQPRAAGDDEQLALAGELFAVARLLEAQPALRRALSDPAGSPQERAALAHRLLDGKVSRTALDLVETVAAQRWSRPVDLIDAMVTLGTEAALDAADARGEVEDVEDELFRFGRIVGGDRELSRLLSDRSSSAEGLGVLLDRLLSGRTTAVTELLLRNVLTSRRAGSAEVAIERLSTAANRRRGRSVARVTTAVALTPAQEQRLAETLGRIYGRTMGLHVTVDPDVLGGLVVQVGDEVIDGSVAHRLEAAKRRLAG
jgi:F-type H+-transporting ATPase subunit delta